MKKIALIALLAMTVVTTGCFDTKSNSDPEPINDGVIQGLITNAETGMPEDGVTLRFHRNSQSGQVVKEAQTFQGTYYVELPRGQYSMEINKAGHITSFVECEAVYPNDSVMQYNSTTTVLDLGEVRIVLSWGANPSDLDAHLTGPGLYDRDHVYWDDQLGMDMSLDVDDTSSYGPETITITDQQMFETYRFFVHDYTNRSSSYSTGLKNSGAKVQIYKGNTLLRTLSVPNTDGTLWKVCEVVGNNVIVLNTMTYASSSSSIEIMNTDSEQNLFRNLPDKN